MNDGALFGFHVTPLTRRRFHNFRANKRGYWSLWIFLALLFTSLFAELIIIPVKRAALSCNSLIIPVVPDDRNASINTK